MKLFPNEDWGVIVTVAGEGWDVESPAPDEALGALEFSVDDGGIGGSERGSFTTGDCTPVDALSVICWLAVDSSEGFEVDFTSRDWRKPVDSALFSENVLVNQSEDPSSVSKEIVFGTLIRL